MKKAKAIVMGAGVSGLAAALTLHRYGIETLVVERESQLGGRVRTDHDENGVLFDRGFQVLLSSYPELSRFVSLDALDLCWFNSGAMIFDGKQTQLLANPWVHPNSITSSFGQSFLSVKDRLLVLKLVLQSQFVGHDVPLGDQTTEDFLQAMGFSNNFVEMFWRPFLTGIFLDPELKSGHQYFQFLVRNFCWGRVAVPRFGMQMLPKQMAEQLPGAQIQMGCSVEGFDRNKVWLSSGETVEADFVVCAHDRELKPSGWKCVTTHYFTGSDLKDTAWDKWLVLVPRKLNFRVDHFCNIGAVSAGYAKGQPLLSVSLIGEKVATIQEIQQEIETIAGRKLNLSHVKSTTVHKALPVSQGLTDGYAERDGVFYCGDQWSSPSINGALRSGRKTAEKIVAATK